MKYISIFGIFMLLATITFAFRQVPICAGIKCKSVKGIVTQVYEAGDQDIVIKLKDHPQHFYINRALERGLKVHEMQNILMDREIIIKHSDQEYLLSPRNASVHISELEIDRQTIFNKSH